MKDANLAIFAISLNQKHITAVSEVGADAQLAVFLYRLQISLSITGCRGLRN